MNEKTRLRNTHGPIGRTGAIVRSNAASKATESATDIVRQPTGWRRRRRCPFRCAATDSRWRTAAVTLCRAQIPSGRRGVNGAAAQATANSIDTGDA